MADIPAWIWTHTAIRKSLIVKVYLAECVHHFSVDTSHLSGPTKYLSIKVSLHTHTFVLVMR